MKRNTRSYWSRRELLKGAGAAASVSFVTGCARLVSSTSGASSYSVASPDRRLKVTLAFPANTSPTWEVSRDGVPILLPSSLGLRAADGTVIGSHARVIGHEYKSIDTSWDPPYGIARTYKDRCEELTVQLDDVRSGVELDIIARSYDQGVALRYRIRKVSGRSLQLSGEVTHFHLPAGAQVYASRDEGEVFVTSPDRMAPMAHPDLTESCDPEPLADVPVTARLPSGHALAISESDRLHYPRLALMAAPGEEDTLVTHLMRFPGRATGYSGPGSTPPQNSFEVEVPFDTPWRVLLIGDRPTAVSESAALIQTLATPSLFEDTSWIRPGRAIRSFRDNTTEGGIACVDFAVQRKLEYIEYDAHWYGDGTDPSDATVPIPGLDIQRVVEYAKQRNVGVILYVDRVPAMRQLDQILQTYSRWGVAGIKFGFIWEGRQSDVDWLFDVLKKCGEHRLLVNLHDNLRPAGLERTLPNYIALEGVRGNEQFPTARHNVTLPFTRNLIGPIDYTICYAHEKNQTTNAHQLAMAVVYYNPLTFLYWYDKPSKYAQGEWPELSFFDECPTTWDETRVLAGEIGEYIVIARRHGQRWFLGAMTNELPRQLDISLSFLSLGAWDAHIYEDGPAARTANQTPVRVSRQSVSGHVELRLALAPGGGQAIRFEPA
jgi:alpha-glucosidase